MKRIKITENLEPIIFTPRITARRFLEALRHINGLTLRGSLPPGRFHCWPIAADDEADCTPPPHAPPLLLFPMTGAAFDA